jgi:hypothetical protein
MESEPEGEAIGHSQSSTQAVPVMIKQNVSWRC